MIHSYSHSRSFINFLNLILLSLFDIRQQWNKYMYMIKRSPAYRVKSLGEALIGRPNLWGLGVERHAEHSVGVRERWTQQSNEQRTVTNTKRDRTSHMYRQGSAPSLQESSRPMATVSSPVMVRALHPLGARLSRVEIVQPTHEARELSICRAARNESKVSAIHQLL